ncbi:TetR/AcrR family transcriptional regulator [Culicoidibacter larvae]|uniref:TetR/AcrR family transcriptional regulator n=1 Tax=Culicoidibacter larvae TaxID=2579976 RepID=A0A5R8Q831_9FIRM|nr:TetR/AcrR family transcriptional regulator [Culicoidibacter larvae]TLG71744.1 TetR/AcrR family transcriptional regulator [Culicoidibacter larvae]
MPPKIKISKQNIIDAVWDITRQQGFKAVNAREIAKNLNCSTHPIFREYTDMDELKNEFISLVEAFYIQFFSAVEKNENFIANVGIKYVEFAIDEPQLFHLLFLEDNYKGANFMDFIENKNENEYLSTDLPELGFDLDSKAAKQIFMNMWLYVHGIATLLVTNTLKMDFTEITDIIQATINGFITILETNVKDEV